jgi:hypothetical protein
MTTAVVVKESVASALKASALGKKLSMMASRQEALLLAISSQTIRERAGRTSFICTRMRAPAVRRVRDVSDRSALVRSR